ncbi:MAG: hypothetical protein L0211_05910 [Planctomycetaceae bacterium]|nr:hypothetical protein [Planctomycetaceae bacterium]
MRTSLGAWCWLSAAIVIGGGGCSGSQPSSGRPEVEGVSDEEHFGASSKALLYEFRAKVRRRGVDAAKQELPQLLEGFEGYENRKLGESAGVYKEIVDKLKALQGTLGSANRDAVIKAADEIGALADKLPGKANPNPEVE